MAKKGHAFNIILTELLVEQLSSLAKNAGTSQAQVIRTLILNAHLMKILGLPCCADGSRCFVPHMHSPVSPDASP